MLPIRFFKQTAYILVPCLKVLLIRLRQPASFAERQ